MRHSTAAPRFRAAALGAAALALTLAACETSTTPPMPQTRVALHGCTHWEQGHLWCSVTVRDADGAPITGLTRDAFHLIEEAAGLGRAEVTLGSTERYFEEPGFWERSVTDERVDLVFLIDDSFTMDETLTQLRLELHALLDGLLSRRTDFRLGFVQYDDHFCGAQIDPLRGPMAEPELRAAIEAVTSRGEWWVPSATFDALLLGDAGEADGLAWRDDAEHVLVVVTDSFSASAYGSIWYTGWTTNAVQSAAAELLGARPARVYYTQPGWAGVEGTDPSNDGYADSDFNPDGLARAGLETLGDPLPWPFAADDLLAALALDAADLADSRYYLAWTSGLELLRAEAGTPVGIRIEVTLPDGTFAVDGAQPAVLREADLALEVRDPRGGLVNEASVIALREMGDLTQELYWDNAVVEGRATVPRLWEGDWLLRVTSLVPYDYDELRWFVEERFTFDPAGPHTRDVTAAMPDAVHELARARGLLADIAAWAPADRPFADFAADARRWLDGLEAAGLDAADLERLKRFNVGLAGYVNSLGYAEAVVDGAVQDFVDAARLLRELFRRLQESSDELDNDLWSWDTLVLLATYLSQLDLDALEKWVEEEALVEGIKEVVLEELVPRAVEYMLDLIRDGVDNGALAAEIIKLVQEIIYGNWNDDPGALGNIVFKVLVLTLDAVLDSALDTVTDEIEAALHDALNDAVGVELPEEAVDLVRVGLEALLGGITALLNDASPEAFLNAVAGRVRAALTTLGESKNVKRTIGVLIDLLHDQVGPGLFRDFALPLLDMVLRTAVDVHGDGKVDADVVVETLARLFCDYLIIGPFFADPTENGMRDLLARAQGFTPSGDFLARSDAMSNDYWNWRGDTMQPANDMAWSALAVQDTMENVESWLSGAEDLLGFAELGTMAACCRYPDFCEAAVEDIPNLISFIQGLRLMTNIIEFAMKIDLLDDLQEHVTAGNPVLWATP
ncbi:MAG: VWA domain-containing protein [Deltaproteobacteria bacterium]|nr:VWA domain-containing protein [Deltaproteobacteria bacterium]